MSGAGRSRGSDSRSGAGDSAGANGRGHAQVAEIQRARMLSAMFDVVGERGVGAVTVAHVVERSGVSRRTFYESFADREACFLAAFDEAVAYAYERVAPAYEARGGWRERIRGALIELLGFLDEQPLIGRVLICESLAGGPRVLERRGRVLASVVAAIDAGREQAKTDPPPLAAEGVVGGVLSILHERLVSDDHGPLRGLANPLMSMIVMPYLGPGAARRELERPVPASSGRQRDTALLSDPFKDAGMRLTYRTVRVLMAVADMGERGIKPSNRAVGEVADITDQGQISKLLARLQRIGLISNAGLGPGTGAPNAWSLTSTGRQVAHSVSAHSARSEDRRVA
jgi:AcrR family transcriptional regulator